MRDTGGVCTRLDASRCGARAQQPHGHLRDAGVARHRVDDGFTRGRGGEELIRNLRRETSVRIRASPNSSDLQGAKSYGTPPRLRVDVLQHGGAVVDGVEGAERHGGGQRTQRRVLRTRHATSDERALPAPQLRVP
jgi:hypothetical protein